MTDHKIDLEAFAGLSPTAAAQLLLTCCSSPAWARAVAARRPYASLEEVLVAADAELDALDEAEIDLALAGHPRIGDRPDSANSAREQAGMATADDAVRAAIAAGNREYEAQFGHVYLVCATGRTPEELLKILTERLGNEPATERRIVRAELAKINRIRLRRLLGEDAA
ncbi:2-oxo-4-hydroxy-4-carboxy-5-ureidoimidazoline decarboxylase [Nocardia crassostreae]|uniref:2-oxo-4-hydroxy-4-carboxy-5-ureidoimidazoline decarboxylase n=1 Tax=Nocardia crassostreae TaxID=53428 RepID=UPI000832BA49|nr:2-oxo-4-hydroxy-4-carboxy-5-ureidoimidazoline decarboxylase [Nocardia crassostreae]